MMEAIEDMLAETAGLDVDAFGRPALDRAVARRMSACAACEPAAYARLLGGSPAELENLLEEVTVLETWFFRDRGPFEYLERHARGRPGLRVLSAPCATGEEPYSIAISLLEAGLPAGGFHVDACDISRRALQVAAHGIYGASSFREDWRDHRNRWFQPVAGGFALRPELAGLVQFHRDDLLHPVFLAAQTPYDVVFCRNLLIYLRPEAQEALIERLGRLLRPDGILITGHAEIARLLRHGYEAVSHSRCFACRKKLAARTPGPLRVGAAIAMPPPAPSPDPARLLAWARQLANEGAFEDAWSLCEELLAQGHDANVYYLQGLISAARDRLAVAEECFRRALYLDPAHYESLMQMGLLCERRGEPARGGLFRSRAARLAASRTEAADARRP